MKEEEKQLLLKDLCARLPYNPIINCEDSDTKYKCFLTTAILDEMRLGTEYYEYKPYLRPLSSMTKEEKYAYRHMLGATLNSEGESIMFVYVEDFPVVIDWLNEHHFDFRELIEKGLALEAPEGMYKS
jgi:hypothetical protein